MKLTVQQQIHKVNAPYDLPNKRLNKFFSLLYQIAHDGSQWSAESINFQACLKDLEALVKAGHQLQEDLSK